MHKLNIIEFVARQQAKRDLEAEHVSPASIPELRARVYKLEKILGINH